MDILLLQAVQRRILGVEALYLRTTSLPGLPNLRTGVLSLNFLRAVRTGISLLLSSRNGYDLPKGRVLFISSLKWPLRVACVFLNFRSTGLHWVPWQSQPHSMPLETGYESTVGGYPSAPSDADQDLKRCIYGPLHFLGYQVYGLESHS